MDKSPENKKLTETEIKKYQIANNVLIGTFIASSIALKFILGFPTNKYAILIILFLPLMGITFAIYYGYFKK